MFYKCDYSKYFSKKHLRIYLEIYINPLPAVFINTLLQPVFLRLLHQQLL